MPEHSIVSLLRWWRREVSGPASLDLRIDVLNHTLYHAAWCADIRNQARAGGALLALLVVASGLRPDDDAIKASLASHLLRRGHGEEVMGAIFNRRASIETHHPVKLEAVCRQVLFESMEGLGKIDADTPRSFIHKGCLRAYLGVCLALDLDPMACVEEFRAHAETSQLKHETMRLSELEATERVLATLAWELNLREKGRALLITKNDEGVKQVLRDAPLDAATMMATRPGISVAPWPRVVLEEGMGEVVEGRAGLFDLHPSTRVRVKGFVGELSTTVGVLLKAMAQAAHDEKEGGEP